MIEVFCDFCQNTCLKRECEVKAVKLGKRKNLFCSKACQYASRSKRTDVSCVCCTKIFSKSLYQIEKTKNNFCSQSCAAKYNNKIPKRKRTNTGNPCPICSNITKNSRLITCSRECSIKHQWNNKKLEIESSGIIYPKGMYYGSDLAKKYIAEINGNDCSICGVSNMWNNKSLVLVLDHINGIPDDWRIDNLRLVCPNCDSQLPTFKNKNKGNGRPKALRYK